MSLPRSWEILGGWFLQRWRTYGASDPVSQRDFVLQPSGCESASYPGTGQSKFSPTLKGLQPTADQRRHAGPGAPPPSALMIFWGRNPRSLVPGTPESALAIAPWSCQRRCVSRLTTSDSRSEVLGSLIRSRGFMKSRSILLFAAGTFPPIASTCRAAVNECSNH